MSERRSLLARISLAAGLLAVIGVALYVFAAPLIGLPRGASSDRASTPARPPSWDQEDIAWNDANPPQVTAKRTWLLPRDAELEDRYVLILTDAATGRGDLVITDRDALLAAQGKAFVEHQHLGVGNSIFAAVITLGQGLSQVSTLAYRGHGGWISRELTCWFCAHDSDSAMPRDLAGLIEAGEPVAQITQTYDTRQAYDAAFKTLRAQSGVWIQMSGSFWADATETAPASGRIKTWQRQPR